MSDSLTEYLGRGIDLFKVDLWSPPSKETVIDPAMLTTHLVNDPLREMGLTITYADSLLDIKQKIAVEAGISGSYGGFSGSVEVKYNHSEELIRKQHFAYISSLITGNRLSIAGGHLRMKQSLTPGFSAALKSASPDDLFDEYGTHIAAAIRIGGRADYYCSTSDITTMSEDDFKLAATAKYTALGGSVEGHVSVETQDQGKLQQVSGSQNLFMIGGSPDLAAKVSEKGGWPEWAKSCQDAPGFLSFDPDNGLVPIWELTDDPDRQKELRAAYHRRAAKAFQTHVMLATSDTAEHPDVSVRVPDGYKLLSGGAFDDWSDPGNMLTASFPEGDNTWRASGKDHVTLSPARVTAYATVTYDPDDIWDVQQFKSDLSQKSHHPSASSSVPDGYTLIGGGAQVQYSGAGCLLTSSYPSDARTWRCDAKDHVESNEAQIMAVAIGLKCKADGLRILQKIQTNTSDKAHWPTTTASPPAEHVMTGGGAKVTYSGDGSLLTASYLKDEETWEGRAKDHLSSDEATIDVSAVGIRIVDA